MGRIRLFPLLFQNGCSQSSRFPTAGQGERRLWTRIGAGLTFKSSHDAHAQDRRRVLSELKNKDTKTRITNDQLENFF